MKKITLFTISFFLSALGYSTIYQTIDNGGGNIGWSTDGGITDCGCQAASAGKQDSIIVLHAYTFPIGYFSDGEIEAPVRVSAGLGNLVLFEDNIDLFKIDIRLYSSTVTFNGKFGITGAGQNVSGVYAYSGSVVSFNDDFGNGKKQDNAEIYLDSSEVVFAPQILIKGMVLTTAFSSNVTLGNNDYLEKCWLINQQNSALDIGNGVIFDDSEVRLYSNIVSIGNNVKFNTDAIIYFGENMNINIPGSVSFNHASVNLSTESSAQGAIVNIKSGVVIVDSEVNVPDGTILNITDPNIYKNNGTPTITVDGLLNLDSVIVITDTRFNVQSKGIINMLDGTSCDFTGSTVNSNTTDAASVLSCGQTYNPDNSEFYIWENGSWSQPSPPNHVGALVEIRDSYVTGTDGDILCGNLYINEDITTTISSGGYIRSTSYFNNLGIMTIKNEGSLIMDENTVFHFDNGTFLVERVGQLSGMKFNVWSSPVWEENLLSIFEYTNPCDMYVFEAKLQSWKYDFTVGTELTCNGNDVVFGVNDVISGADGFFDRGRGYFIPGNNVDSIHVFNGSVNNSIRTIKINTSNLGNQPYWQGDDWNLVGNPYPSGLDLNLLWGENAIKNPYITDAIYFWVETANPPYDEFGSYEAWNPLGGTYFYDSNEKVNSINGIVPAGMGFWVYANDPDDSGSKIYDFKFDNTMRVINQAPLAKSNHYRYQTSERHRIWLNLTNDSNGYDQVLIGTLPSATDGIDALYDAHLNYNGENMLLATVQENQYFTINSFAPRIKVDTTEIELFVMAANESNHYLTIDSSLIYLNEKRVFLLDKEKGTEQEMLENQSILLDIDTAGKYEQRFYLRVTNSHITGVAEIENGLDGRVWSFGNEIFYDNFLSNISEITVYDLRGVEIYRSWPKKRNSQFTIGTQVEGIFIVRLKDVRGNMRTERVYLNSN